jgi:hypothetical protein
MNDTQNAAPTEIDPAKAAWQRPRLRLLDIGASEATPGGNAEGDGTS